jgi:gamma-glutamyltranspeptidase/glutathione hydrolase
MKDLANWRVIEEEPLMINYKGIEAYKLKQWTQGPVLLQALNILENFDLKAMGYNSSKYIHTVYQAMNLSFADRDFYYGDPYTSPSEPIKGLLNKDYAKQRAALIRYDKNDVNVGPGNPYLFENKPNPYLELLKKRGFEMDSTRRNFAPKHDLGNNSLKEDYQDRLWRGTTSIEAADKEGWVVSVTPSGGWLPACIAGNTGIGMSQRMQSFVLDSTLNPFNVVAPGKRPRVTLSPSLFLKDGKPFLSAAVQGGDTQDQNLLQFFLNVAEFDMTVQRACEAANFNTNQLWLSLGGTKTSDRAPKPGQILLNRNTTEAVRAELKKMGYDMSFAERTSGPINAIYFDWKHGSLWGGSSNHGEDYGIGW